MKIRTILIAFVFLQVMAPSVLANPTSSGPRMVLSPQFINDETFTEIKSVKDIPQSVKDEFVKLAQQPNFMSDPGKNFAVGCVRSENQAARRLILGAVNAKHCVLFYEKGGYAHQYLIAAFELNGNECKVSWKGSANFESAPKVKTLTELKKLLNTGKTLEASYL